MWNAGAGQLGLQLAAKQSRSSTEYCWLPLGNHERGRIVHVRRTDYSRLHRGTVIQKDLRVKVTRS